MTSQFNVRIPESTQQQLEKLIADTGMTQTQIVILAIDRFYQSRERTRPMNNLNHLVWDHDNKQYTGTLPGGERINVDAERYDEVREMMEDEGMKPEEREATLHNPTFWSDMAQTWKK